MTKRKANEKGRAVLARLQRGNEAKLTQMRAGQAVQQPAPVELPETKPGPVPPSRRQILKYATERLECVQATLQYQVVGRNGHSLNVVEITRADRGILEAKINGQADHSNHVSEAMQKAEFFFRDMAEMTARTLNGRPQR